jgi:hypothetical protein
MLASDLNNPEFVGARNPDELLQVEFYWHTQILQRKSLEAGKEVLGARIPYIRICRPGDRDTILETPVRNDHKARFPQKWLAWQIKEGLVEGVNDEVPGWKIDEWPVVKADQLHELKYMRFHTVEQIAMATDAQVQRMGIGGIGLREQAKLALKERSRVEYKVEMDAKQKELDDMRERMAKMEAFMASMPAPVAKQETLTLPKGK